MIQETPRQKIALLRTPDLSIAHCELTHIPREIIDYEAALAEHRHYAEVLNSLGLEVQYLPPLSGAPDGVFVEDTAIVLDPLAVLTRSAVVSRRAEAGDVVTALGCFRKVIRKIEDPGTLDGGDVLQIDKQLFVGLSSRTNLQGVEQLRQFVSPYGYEVVTLPIQNSLHLKTAVTYLGQDTILVNPQWVSISAFRSFDPIFVDPAEPFGANALRVGGKLLHSGAYPKTAARISSAGFELIEVSTPELAKAEAGLTCLSLVFRR